MNNKHRWFSGRIIAFQAVDPGSIPGRCIFDFVRWLVFGEGGVDEELF